MNTFLSLAVKFLSLQLLSLLYYIFVYKYIGI